MALRDQLQDDDVRALFDATASHHLDKFLEVERRRRERERERDRKSIFSLGKAVAQLSGNGNLTGCEREYLEETAAIAGLAFNPGRIVLPWALFRGAVYLPTLRADIAGLSQRDLAVAAHGGAYLVPGETQAAALALRPWSVVVSAGVTIEAGLRGNVTYPSEGTTPTVEWLTDETTEATPADPILAPIASVPKLAAAVVRFSRQLNLQSLDTTPYVSRSLLRAAGVAIDTAAIAGAGGIEPRGVVGAAGVGSVTGTALNIAALAEAKSDIAAANASEEGIAFVTTPGVRELLEQRIGTGSSAFLWANDRLVSKPAYVSSTVPSATLIAGAWPLLTLGLWGPGVELEVTSLASKEDFQAGIISARVLIACDVTLQRPAAFVVAESVT